MNNKSIKENEFLKKCSQLLEAYKKRVFGLNNSEDIIRYSNEFYKGLKEIAAYYYPDEEVPFYYRNLVRDIFLFERFLPQDYLFSFQSHDFSKILDKPISLKNEEAILNYLVDQTRNFLFDKVSFDRTIFPYESYDLQNQCVEAADFLTECSAKMGIESRRIIIYPCFQRNSGVMGGNIHAFSLVKINESTYLVDCTYSQFFTIYRCNLNRIGVPLFAGCAPGTFMQYDSFYQEMAQNLLNRGWVKYDDKILKAYLDGFLLSYRNGLFYQRTKDFSFTTNYTALDYENFIYGKDNLFQHEKKEELGFQLKPLTNPNMIIKHK